jgi:uncharacterized membrane protein
VSEKREKRARHPARRHEKTIAGPTPGPAILRQEELFPASIEVTEATSFSGPLPPPDLLAEYEQVIPGLADRIVRMAEEEGRHRRWLQRALLRFSWGGLISGLAIAMTGLGGGFYLIDQGKSPEGMTSIVGALATLLAVFLMRGRRSSAKE